MRKRNYVQKLFSWSLLFLLSAFLNPAITAQEASEQDNNLPVSPLLAKKYDLEFRVDIEKREIFSQGFLTVANVGNEKAEELPLILYKDLRVDAIKCQDGNDLKYTQKVVFFPDEPEYKVNYILVKLNELFTPGTERKFYIRYSGTIDESRNTDGYVRDSINSEFTYIRTETNAYPMICYPNYKNRRQTFEHFWTGHPFDYRVKIIVPKEYAAANTGRLIEKTETEKGVQYIYENILGAWRIDIMVAQYACLNDPESKIKMFFFPEDSETAEKAFEFQQKAYRIYTQWFGSLNDTPTGFTIIQTPGWDGGQSDITGVIQSGRISVRSFPGYAHEIAHFWGPNTPEKYRWINEGQASYLQYRLLKEMDDEKELEEGMLRRRKAFTEYIEKYPEARELTLNDYVEKGEGKHDHVMNYHKGAWVYYLLDTVVGEDTFNRIISSLYNDFKGGLVTNEHFIKQAEKISGKKLSKFWQDWIYSSSSTEFLLDNLSLEEMAEKYL